MPIKDELPSSKLHLMLPGAISFQSKANKLPQSTTQVLINIQAFAFKRGPIYRSFPSICETRHPLCSPGCLRRSRFNMPQSGCLYIRLQHLVSLATRRGCAKQSIFNLCWWSAQIPHYSHHGCFVTHFLICHCPLYLEIKYLGTWTAAASLHLNGPFFLFFLLFFKFLRSCRRQRDALESGSMRRGAAPNNHHARDLDNTELLDGLHITEDRRLIAFHAVDGGQSAQRRFQPRLNPIGRD